MEWLALWCLFALFSAIVAWKKGLRGIEWALVGLFLGPIGLLALSLPPKPRGQTQPAVIRPS